MQKVWKTMERNIVHQNSNYLNNIKKPEKHNIGELLTQFCTWYSIICPWENLCYPSLNIKFISIKYISRSNQA